MKYRVRILTSYRGESEDTLEADTATEAMEKALQQWASLTQATLSNRRESDGGIGYSAHANASLFPSGRDHTDVSARIV